jgi:hypothetical protein
MKTINISYRDLVTAEKARCIYEDTQHYILACLFSSCLELEGSRTHISSKLIQAFSDSPFLLIINPLSQPHAFECPKQSVFTHIHLLLLSYRTSPTSSSILQITHCKMSTGASSSSVSAGAQVTWTSVDDAAKSLLGAFTQLPALESNFQVPCALIMRDFNANWRDCFNGQYAPATPEFLYRLVTYCFPKGGQERLEIISYVLMINCTMSSK